MRVSVTEAKAQLTELVRRAEAGEEVILTRHGQAAVRLSPIKTRPDAASRRALLEAVRKSAALNFGDCFAYDVANEYSCPLLFVGNGFARTDLASALAVDN